jgi:hypothetical protein
MHQGKPTADDGRRIIVVSSAGHVFCSVLSVIFLLLDDLTKQVNRKA